MDNWLLCHYTTLATLQKLIEGIRNSSFVFHASHAFSMNDPQEILFGYEALMKVINDYEYSHHIQNEYRISSIEHDYQMSEDKWEDFLFQRLFEEQQIPYLVSFSHEEDSLPMWNMYGGRGTGVNLCFWGVKFSVSEGVQDISMVSDKDIIISDVIKADDVVYDNYSNAQILRIGSIYKKMMNDINKLERNLMLQQKLNCLLQLINIFAPMIKNSAYQYEQEARYIERFYKATDILYRTNSRGIIIPYIEKEIPISALKHITIGPCADFLIVRRFVEMELKQKGLHHVVVKKSCVPYRNL